MPTWMLSGGLAVGELRRPPLLLLLMLFLQQQSWQSLFQPRGEAEAVLLRSGAKGDTAPRQSV